MKNRATIKNIIAVFVTAALGFALCCGCGNTGDSSDDTENSATAETTDLADAGKAMVEINYKIIYPESPVTVKSLRGRSTGEVHISQVRYVPELDIFDILFVTRKTSDALGDDHYELFYFRYTITDKETGDVVAEGTYTPHTELKVGDMVPGTMDVPGSLKPGHTYEITIGPASE